MLGQLERYIRAAIVDKNPQNASAALIAGYRLLPVAPDVVRRWNADVQSVATSSSTPGIVQYHAIGLMYGMRRSDKQAVAKMVSQLAKYVLRLRLYVCMFVLTCVQLPYPVGADAVSALCCGCVA